MKGRKSKRKKDIEEKGRRVVEERSRSKAVEEKKIGGRETEELKGTELETRLELKISWRGKKESKDGREKEEGLKAAVETGRYK